MGERSNCTVFVGNLDEKVSDRVLYDILIQAGRVVDLYIPRDKETDRPKGIAFAQYESEEIADYAVRLFSGLVTLCNRTLRFAISGQDKPSMNSELATPTATNSSHKPRPLPVIYNNQDVSPHTRSSTPCRLSDHQFSHQRVPAPSVVPLHQPNGYRSSYDGNSYDYSRRVFGAALDSITNTSLSHYDSRTPANYYSSY